MQHGIQSLQIIFLLLLFFSVAFAALAERMKVPYPIILLVAGLLLSFAPAVPRIDLDPHTIFFVFLPPLLYAAAWNTSWREFSFNLASILMLAIGLVVFTVLGVSIAAPWLFSGFDWRSAAVLGAVVSTTDAIAATAILNRLGVDRRLVVVLEGESLINDATGLLALEFGIAILLTAEPLDVGHSLLRLGYLSGAGIATGLVIGVIVDWIERRIDNGPIEMAISILVAYASYFTAEALDASGVLAVVVCGLYLSRRSVHFFTPGVRIQAAAVWDAFTFVLNGFVFLLIGLQFPQVLAGIRGYNTVRLIELAAFFALLVIGLRFLWMYPGARIAYWIRLHVLRQKVQPLSNRQIFVVGWSGMRGVIALAAAMSLPHAIPYRHLIVFLTFIVILATLVVQGLTLPLIIRWLGITAPTGTDPEEFRARRAILEAALRQLERMRDSDAERFADVYDDLAQHYHTRLTTLTGEGSDEHGTSAEHAQRYLDITRELLGLERQTAVDLRNTGKISDSTLRRILNELDLSETRMDSAVTT